MFAAALGAVLVGAMIWWSTDSVPAGDVDTAPVGASMPARAPVRQAFESASLPATPPLDGAASAAKASSAPIRVQATELMAAYRDTQGRIHHRLEGQALTITGTLVSQEPGAGGLWLLTLAAGDEGGPPARLVVPADQAQALAGLSAGASLQADCVHGGTVMGEPILRDCRVRVRSSQD